MEGGVGGWVVGPVMASADRLVVDALGATACSRPGAGVAVTGGVAVAVGAARADAGAAAEWVAAAVEAGAVQTWANRTEGGGAPKADV